jgi:hypothetical protein
MRDAGCTMRGSEECSAFAVAELSAAAAPTGMPFDGAQSTCGGPASCATKQETPRGIPRVSTWQRRPAAAVTEWVTGAAAGRRCHAGLLAAAGSPAKAALICPTTRRATRTAAPGGRSSPSAGMQDAGCRMRDGEVGRGTGWGAGGERSRIGIRIGIRIGGNTSYFIDAIRPVGGQPRLAEPRSNSIGHRTGFGYWVRPGGAGLPQESVGTGSNTPEPLMRPARV